MQKRSLKIIILTLLLAASAAIHGCAENRSIALVHPVEVERMPVCSDCHTDSYAAFNHTPDFSASHRFYAEQQKMVCNTCHQESFCADCHAHKEQLKPSDKFKDSPERYVPHRGDYLSQHMIDGRINPAACFRCHGRNNNERCRTCHR